MTMGILKKLLFREMKKKAIELHNKGLNIEQIKEKFYAESRVAQGLPVIGVSDEELTEMIEKEIKKKGDK